MEQTNDYISCDCDLYDVYILYISQKTKVTMASIDGSFLPYETFLSDIYTHEKAEYLKTEGGVSHRLDKIVVTQVANNG